MIYVICRKPVVLKGYLHIESINELKKLPKNSEVILAGPIPFDFLHDNALYAVAQELNLTLKAIH